MKSVFVLSLLFVLITACSSDADKFAGTWQSVKDPSKKLIISQNGDTYTFEAINIKTSLIGQPGTYNAENHALDFVNEDGTITQLVYNVSVGHVLGLGHEFEKTSPADATTAAAEQPAESENTEATQEDEAAQEKGASCEKGDILTITGNNVRVRKEPDVTKQNILFQVHLNFEVTRLGDKTVDGQKWYKVCYEGQQGWVSGQYATPK